MFSVVCEALGSLVSPGESNHGAGEQLSSASWGESSGLGGSVLTDSWAGVVGGSL